MTRQPSRQVVRTEHRDPQAGDHPDQHDQQRPGPQRPGRGGRLVPGPPACGHWPPHPADASCSARSTTLVSSIARVIGPTPPGTGATQRGHLVHAGVEVADQAGVGPGDADVDADRTGLDHVGGDQPGRPAAATTMSACRVCCGDVDGAGVAQRDGGVLALAGQQQPERPAHRGAAADHADLGPAQRRSRCGAAARRCRAACTAAVPGAPSTSRPRLTGCSPSASLAGSTSPRAQLSSRLPGSGSWTM